MMGADDMSRIDTLLIQWRCTISPAFVVHRFPLSRMESPRPKELGFPDRTLADPSRLSCPELAFGLAED